MTTTLTIISELERYLNSDDPYDKALVQLAKTKRAPDQDEAWVASRLAEIEGQFPDRRNTGVEYKNLLRNMNRALVESRGVSEGGLRHTFTGQLADGPALLEVEYLECDKYGPDSSSQLNVETFLAVCHIGVRFNEFTFEYELTGLKEYPTLDDRALVVIQKGMEATDFRPSLAFLHGALMVVGERKKYHPVRDYLDKLEWDGISRVDRLFIDYAGAEDTPLNERIASCLMIAAARRIYQPGTKFDTIPIMEGLQGLQKSTFFKVLAKREEWFTDNLTIGADSKEVIEQTQGKWFVELAEMRGLSKKDAGTVKAFASKDTDEARLAYARTVTKRKRQFICVGTTNGGAEHGAYLIDDTGNRRFWPFEVKGTTVEVSGGKEVRLIDLDKLREDLEQLWAEAVHRHKAGESIVLPKELWGVAAVEQDKRRALPGVEESIRAQVEGIDGGYIMDADLYASVGLGNESATRRTQAHRDAVTNAMTACGWKRQQRRAPEGVVRAWFKGDIKFKYVFDPLDKKLKREVIPASMRQALLPIAEDVGDVGLRH